jgi:hypothetical protein
MTTIIRVKIGPFASFIEKCGTLIFGLVCLVMAFIKLIFFSYLF